MKIKELKAGMTGTVECIVMGIEEKETKSKDMFLNITVSDGESQDVLKKWNEKKDSFPYKEGRVILAEVKAEAYNGGVSYIIKNIVESSADPRQFIVSAPVDAEAMFQFLLKTAGKCGVYAKTVTRILTDNKEKLLTWGAARSMHHNISGGLLYHTYRMTKTAAYITSVYNKEPSMLKNCRDINTELLVAGTIVHDIGKLQCLDTNMFGASEYTVKEKLMGHLFLGAELVGKYAREDKMKEEDVMLLQHMILAHHGVYEYQTVALAAIPEAMILHHIDMIDSRMYMFEVQESELEPGTMSQNAYLGLSQNVYRPSWRIPKEN